MFNTIKRKFTVIDIMLHKGLSPCYQIEKNGHRGWFENHNYIIGDEVTEFYKKTNLTTPYRVIINRKINSICKNN